MVGADDFFTSYTKWNILAKFETFVHRVTDSRLFALKPPDYHACEVKSAECGQLVQINMTEQWSRNRGGISLIPSPSFFTARLRGRKRRAWYPLFAHVQDFHGIP